MGEGRVPTRARARKSPALAAGLFRWRTLLQRPEISSDALASYRSERLADVTLSVCFGLVEGGFVGVVAAKLYGLHPAGIALIGAAHMFGNITSVWWSRLGARLRKVPLITILQAVVVLLIATVALLPRTPRGGALLVLIVVLVRLIVGGLVALRSVVWTQNYPAAVRARVTSRLTLLASLVVTCTAAFGSFFLDRFEDRIGALYGVGAIIALVGVISYARVRMRGEEDAGDLPVGFRAAVAEGAESAPASGRFGFGLGVFAILREDPLFGRYQLWQFLLGVSNMMVETALVYVVSRELHASYTTGVAITVVIPFALGTALLPFWAAVVDRVHIATFRARHSWFFVVAQALTGVGALLGSLPILVAARMVVGVARGGGSIAWQLGHNHFAPPERAGLYMSLHVTLTGLRGMIAPFLGMWLYVGSASREFAGIATPAFPGIGGWAMIGAAVISTGASLGFLSLHRRIARGS